MLDAKVATVNSVCCPLPYSFSPPISSFTSLFCIPNLPTARVPGYLFAPDQKKSSIGELEVELDAAQEAGHTGASFVDRCDEREGRGKKYERNE